ncbi:hypothetical protein SLS58_000572 [Diplodia intermedia]|uniref:Uncharacterized protein n=1 Tax=Diplodia intermedia TaxID=856260 RepID=A0ABR3U4S9_9PEZI
MPRKGAKGKAKAKASGPKKDKKGKAADELPMDEFARICDESTKKSERSGEERLPAPFPKRGPRRSRFKNLAELKAYQAGIVSDSSDDQQTAAGAPPVFDEDGTPHVQYETVTDERDGRLLGIILPNGELRMVLNAETPHDGPLQTRKAEPDEYITHGEPVRAATSRQSVGLGITEAPFSSDIEAHAIYAAELLKQFATVPDPPTDPRATHANAAQWNLHIQELTRAIRAVNAGSVVVNNAFNLGEAGDSGEQLRERIHLEGTFVSKEFAKPDAAKARSLIDITHAEMVKWVFRRDNGNRETGDRDFRETFTRMWKDQDNAVEITKNYMDPERKLAHDRGIGDEVERLMPELADAHLAGNVLEVAHLRGIVDSMIANPEHHDGSGKNAIVLKSPILKLSEDEYYAISSPIESATNTLARSDDVVPCDCHDCSDARDMQDSGSTAEKDEQQSVNKRVSSEWSQWAESIKSTQPRESSSNVLKGDKPETGEQPEGGHALGPPSESPKNPKPSKKKKKKTKKKGKKISNPTPEVVDLEGTEGDTENCTTAADPPDLPTPANISLPGEDTKDSSATEHSTPINTPPPEEDTWDLIAADLSTPIETSPAEEDTTDSTAVDFSTPVNARLSIPINTPPPEQGIRDTTAVDICTPVKAHPSIPIDTPPPEQDTKDSIAVDLPDLATPVKPELSTPVKAPLPKEDAKDETQLSTPIGTPPPEGDVAHPTFTEEDMSCAETLVTLSSRESDRKSDVSEILMPKIMAASRIPSITGLNPRAKGFKRVYYFPKNERSIDSHPEEPPKLVKSVRNRSLNFFCPPSHIECEIDGQGPAAKDPYPREPPNLAGTARHCGMNFLAEPEDETLSPLRHIEAEIGGAEEVVQPWVEDHEKTLQPASPTMGPSAHTDETETTPHFAEPFEATVSPLPPESLSEHDSNLSTDDSNLPANDSNLPADDSNFPADDSNLPTDNSNLPTDDSNFPTDDSNFQTDDSNFQTDEGDDNMAKTPTSTVPLRVSTGQQTNADLAAVPDWFHSELNKRLQPFVAENEALKERVALLDAQLQPVIAEKEALQEQVANLDAQLQPVIAEKEAMQEQCAKLESQNEDSKGKIAYLEAFNSKFQNTNEVMTQLKKGMDELLKQSMNSSKPLLAPDDIDESEATASDGTRDEHHGFGGEAVTVDDLMRADVRRRTKSASG